MKELPYAQSSPCLFDLRQTLFDYIPVSGEMKSLLALNAYPAVLEADVSVSIVEINGKCTLTVSTLGVNGNRIVGSHVITVIGRLACYRVVCDGGC